MEEYQSSNLGEEELMKKYKEFMFAPDELPVYMADPKVFILIILRVGQVCKYTTRR